MTRLLELGQYAIEQLEFTGRPVNVRSRDYARREAQVDRKLFLNVLLNYL
jgi:hypothetical protein